MKLSSFLREDLIQLELQSKTKNDVIQECIDLISKAGEITNKEEFKKTILEREQLETTGIGDGIAIPHGRTDAVKQLVIAFGKSKDGIDFQSLDGNPAYLFFMIASPQNASGVYLRVLAKISRLLKSYDFRTALRNAETPAQVIEIFQEAEKE
jgi:fructose-specific phosphotransferase system IIA component